MEERKNWQDKDSIVTAIITEEGETELQVIQFAIECLLSLSHIEDLVEEKELVGTPHFCAEVLSKSYQGTQSNMVLEYQVKIYIYFD